MMKNRLDLAYKKEWGLYSDVMESLLKAVQDENDIEKCLMEENAWPYLYHLSNIRENILEWYDFNSNGTLLEIGSGCGALTGLFCRKVSHVTAIEPMRQCSLINRKRNEHYHNLTIFSGNFEDMKIEEKFDYVTLIGVFAYSASYISSENPFMDMLEKAKNFLKPNGKLMIAIENKYGLKYFAGAAEDHTGRCFDGLENYVSTRSVKTFSRKTLEKMLRATGFSHNEFYYPMPDYKLPTEIYSDRHLPSFGSIRYACVSYDRDRYELLDERLAYDSICEDGMFRDFANSFLVISDRKSDDMYKQDILKTVEYAKYSSLRAPKFQIRTRIIIDRNGVRCAEKSALHGEARGHVEKLSKNLQKLLCTSSHYTMEDHTAASETNCIFPMPVNLLYNANGKAVFPYMNGISLAKKVSKCLYRKEKFLSAMHEAVEQIYGFSLKFPENLVKFKVTKDFETIFGSLAGMQNAAIIDGMQSLRVSNIDSILSNYIEQPDGKLICLDYEWVYDFPVPVEYLIYRTVFYYFSENRAYIEPYISEQEYLNEFGLTKEKVRIFCQMEEHFQQYVHGQNHKYAYTANYVKKTVNIGKNLQNGEAWFLSIINDINRLNHEIGEYRREFVVCRVKMHRKSLFFEKCKGLAKNLWKIKDHANR